MSEADAMPVRFSVIVCSWKRPLWLKRCLLSLRQLDYSPFEIVVVADTASLKKIDGSGLKLVPFGDPNLSLARNAGIEASGGEICAFIDDDAVAEPMWLAQLANGFLVTGASAAAGYVRGRNGISFQSRLASVDREAETHEEANIDRKPKIPSLSSGRSVKLVGTNMAIQRNVLVSLGGFDPSYRYFLEDTDLSIRLSDAGFTTAIISDAEVHHAFASSSRRTRMRAPKTLFDIGRSTAIFLRRHNPKQLDEIHARLVRRERKRLIRHLVQGTCEPRDIGRLMTTLERGWVEGLAAPLQVYEKLEKINQFQKFDSLPTGHNVHTSRFIINRHAARRLAGLYANSGQRVSLFSFSFTPFRHHIKFTDDGVWFQTGGLFGRTERNQPLVRWCRFAKREKDEIARVAIARGLGD